MSVDCTWLILKISKIYFTFLAFPVIIIVWGAKFNLLDFCENCGIMKTTEEAKCLMTAGMN